MTRAAAGAYRSPQCPIGATACAGSSCALRRRARAARRRVVAADRPAAAAARSTGARPAVLGASCPARLGVIAADAPRRSAGEPAAALRDRGARARARRRCSPTAPRCSALHTLGVACSQLEPRRALPGFTIGIVAMSAHARLPARPARSPTALADTSRDHLLLHGLPARQLRMAQARRALVQEHEATRERARAGGHAARAPHGSPARCTTCSPTRSPRSRCSSRARACSRARRDADPSVIGRDRARPPPRRARASTRRGARSRRCAATTCPGRTGCPRWPTQFRERTASSARSRSTASRASCRSEARLAVYRTAQEALTNVRRHAEAERVDLRLRYARDGTRLTVEDSAARGRPRRGRAGPGSATG